MAAKKAAKKAAPDKKPAPRPLPKQDKAPEQPAPRSDTSPRSEDKAGVGNDTHPGNNRVPDSAIIRRNDDTEQGTKASTTSPEVQGDKTLQIIDIRQGCPVHPVDARRHGSD